MGIKQNIQSILDDASRLVINHPDAHVCQSCGKAFVGGSCPFCIYFGNDTDSVVWRGAQPPNHVQKGTLWFRPQDATMYVFDGFTWSQQVATLDAAMLVRSGFNPPTDKLVVGTKWLNSANGQMNVWTTKGEWEVIDW